MQLSLNYEKLNKDNAIIWMVVVFVVTLIISLMEFRLPLILWIKEIGTNFVLSFCIVSIIVLFDLLFNITDIKNKLTGFIKILILFTIAGLAGGFIAWQINKILFDFHITNPEIFLSITSVFSIVFGLLTYTYIFLRERLLKAQQKIHQNEINEQILLRLNKEAELKALRAMVNPHFLFNTLNSISSLIYEDTEKAEDTIQKLSSLFRRILNASDKEFHSLKDEVNFIEDYLIIEKVRLGDKLEYNIDADETIENVQIPSMLLQPLVENAIIHGIAKLKFGGRIVIKCSKDNSNIAFEITNTIVKNAAVNDNRFGITGIVDRLKLHFGNDFNYDIVNSENEYKAKLVFPFQKSTGIK